MTCPEAASGSPTPRALVLDPRALPACSALLLTVRGRAERQEAGSLAKQASFRVAAPKGPVGRVKGSSSKDG